MLTGVFDLRCKACSYARKGLDQKEANTAVKAHMAEHPGVPGHRPECTERLPRAAVVGDKVRIKSDLQAEFEKLYGEDAFEAHIVEGEFDRRLYGEAMLKLVRRGDGPQIIVRPNQVELAWRNDAERRAGLTA